ncbi:MAG: DUF5333 domain-containing protein [Pseudomonadota bacterium]
MIRILVLIGLIATPAAARTPADVPEVVNGLVTVGAADLIRKNCDSIAPRMIRAVGFIKSLESTARGAGFSSAEVDAYVDDAAEKERLLAMSYKVLFDKGVDPAAPATYCTVGRAEIGAGSQIGRLLKNK